MSAAPRRTAAAPLSAFVLHSWDWSETSLIVELFTRERGRVVVVAKGAKRPYSQLRPVLVPFQRLQVLLGRPGADASAEVLLLRSAERAAGPPMPSGAALFSGFYLNELLLKLLARDDDHPALFDAYADAVGGLQDHDEAAVQTLLRAFELVLLRETGVLPDLRVETLTQQPVTGARRYTLQAEAGVVAAAEGGIGGAALSAIETALAQGDLAGLRAALAASAPALRAPLRQVLHYHLGGSQLRTRQVLSDVQKLFAR